MLNYFPVSPADWLTCFVVFFLGAGICVSIASKYGAQPLIGLILYVWHTLSCIAYIYLTVTQRGGDLIGYYLRSFDSFQEFRFGTAAVIHLTRFFSHSLGMSFLATNLIYNIVGAIGLVFLYCALRALRGRGDWLVWTIVLLPSVSFWSSVISKDSIAFAAASIISWWFATGRQRLWPLPVTFTLLLIVRPHMAAIFAAALVIGAVTQFRTRPIRAFFSLIAGGIGAVLVLPIVLNMVSIEALTFDAFEDYVSGRETKNMLGGSSFDLSSLPYWLRIPSYLFRPMPFEIKNFMELTVSLENILLAVLLGSALSLSVLRRQVWAFRSGSELLAYSMTGLFVLAVTTANLGIATRQKWMVLVPLLTWVVSVISTRKTDRVSESGATGNLRPLRSTSLRHIDHRVAATRRW